MAHASPPSPYDFLPELPTFTVTSTDIVDGETMPLVTASGLFGIPGGEDVSPQLAWSGFPAETQSFTVSCFDPDAPTASGFWHWFVVDVPASVTELATGAGTAGSGLLPAGAFELQHDGGGPGFIGAAPPAGHGPHRYQFVVHAVGAPTLGIDASATNAFAGFNLFHKAIARATITGLWEA